MTKGGGAVTSRSVGTGPDDTSTDFFHDGQVEIVQPGRGYRAAIDPVFLAAALDAPGKGACLLDVGCGVGVAGLCAKGLFDRELAGIGTGVEILGVDVDRATLTLADENARRNPCGDGGACFRAEWVDIAKRETWPAEGRWDQVFSNPPYLEYSRASGKACPAAALANRETGVALAGWIGFMLAMARPKGRLVLVHRADRLSDIVSCLKGGGAGDIEIFPLWPRRGEAAKRVVIRARKGVRTVDRVLPGMVLHESGGAYTAEALAVLQGKSRLPF